MTHKRLALFLCDTPPPTVVAQDGDYRVIFRELLRKSLPDPPVTFTVNDFDVRNKMEYPEDVGVYDGIIMTGSAASAYENLEWINQLVAYIASVAEEKPQVKLIGICFGHQIIARALGTDVVPNDGKWEVGPTKLDLTDKGKKLFGVDTLNIQSMHRDHVPAVPASCHLLGSSSICPNQGFVRLLPSASDPPEVTDIQIFTVQGHPEFTRRIVDTLVDLRGASGVLNASIVEDARARAGWRNDGVDVVGRVIWRVLGVGESAKT